MFFDASDGMFVNYNWDLDLLHSSHERAQHRTYDLFFGIDCWGRGTYGGGQYTSHKALQALHDLQTSSRDGSTTSVAFFAPGWTFEGRRGGRKGFDMVERRFWYGTNSSTSFLIDLDVDPTFLSSATTLCDFLTAGT